MSAPPVTIAVASGKGGTGKTLVATNLAVRLAREGRRVTIVDCDVEAPNDHLFFDARSRVQDVRVPVARVDQERCTLCGACRDACAYGALRILGESLIVFPELCHGCGLCAAVCPVSAMTEEPVRVGEVLDGRIAISGGESGSLDLVTGLLDVGQVRTPDVIRAARRTGESHDPAVTVLDAPPGVSCAAVAAIRGADAVVLVSEETVFGLHDLELAYELAEALGIPTGLVVNRAVADASIDLEAWAAEHGVPVLARIPFGRDIAATYADGRLVLDACDEATDWFDRIAEGALKMALTGGAVV